MRLEDIAPFCSNCGLVCKSETAVRKHILEEHYNYLLAQCRGNKELLRNWVKGYEKE